MQSPRSKVQSPKSAHAAGAVHEGLASCATKTLDFGHWTLDSVLGHWTLDLGLVLPLAAS
jgi:hypothetical protein